MLNMSRSKIFFNHHMFTGFGSLRYSFRPQQIIIAWSKDPQQTHFNIHQCAALHCVAAPGSYFARSIFSCQYAPGYMPRKKTGKTGGWGSAIKGRETFKWEGGWFLREGGHTPLHTMMHTEKLCIHFTLPSVGGQIKLLQGVRRSPPEPPHVFL